MPGRHELRGARGEEPAHLGPLADEADGERHEHGLLFRARRVGEEERRLGEEPGERRDERLGVGLPFVRRAKRVKALLVGEGARAGPGALEEGRDVDLDRERPDRPPVPREGLRVGPRFFGAVGSGKRDPRHLDEVVIFRGAPEDGREVRSERRQGFGDLHGREGLDRREERPRQEADLLAREDPGATAGGERGEGRVGAAAGHERAEDHRGTLRDRRRRGPLAEEPRHVGLAGRVPEREARDSRKALERDGHRAAPDTARRMRRGDRRASNGEPSKSPKAAVTRRRASPWSASSSSRR